MKVRMVNGSPPLNGREKSIRLGKEKMGIPEKEPFVSTNMIR